MAWYTATPDFPPDHELASSEDMREEYENIQSAFETIDSPYINANKFYKVDANGKRVVALTAPDAGLITGVIGTRGLANERTGSLETISPDIANLPLTDEISSSDLFLLHDGRGHLAINVTNTMAGLDFPGIRDDFGIVINLDNNVNLDFGKPAGAQGIASDDDIFFWDVSESSHKKITRALFNASLNVPSDGASFDSVAVGTGLGGGGSEGAVVVSLDLSAPSLVTTVAARDKFYFSDASDVEDGNIGNKAITKDDLEDAITASIPSYTFSAGLSNDSGTVTVDIAGLTSSLTALEDDDLIIIEDDDGVRKITVANAFADLPEAYVTSITGGSGINAASAAAEGEGGVGTGAVTLKLDINDLTEATVMADGDLLVASDESAVSFPTYKHTLENLTSSLSIPAFSAGDGIAFTTDGITMDLDGLDELAAWHDDDGVLARITSGDGVIDLSDMGDSLEDESTVYSGGGGMAVSEAKVISTDFSTLPLIEAADADNAVGVASVVSNAQAATHMQLLKNSLGTEMNSGFQFGWGETFVGSFSFFYNGFDNPPTVTGTQFWAVFGVISGADVIHGFRKLGEDVDSAGDGLSYPVFKIPGVGWTDTIVSGGFNIGNHNHSGGTYLINLSRLPASGAGYQGEAEAVTMAANTLVGTPTDSVTFQVGTPFILPPQPPPPPTPPFHNMEGFVPEPFRHVFF